MSSIATLTMSAFIGAMCGLLTYLALDAIPWRSVAWALAEFNDRMPWSTGPEVSHRTPDLPPFDRSDMWDGAADEFNMTGTETLADMTWVDPRPRDPYNATYDAALSRSTPDEFNSSPSDPAPYGAAYEDPAYEDPASGTADPAPYYSGTADPAPYEAAAYEFKSLPPYPAPYDAPYTAPDTALYEAADDVDPSPPWATLDPSPQGAAPMAPPLDPKRARIAAHLSDTGPTS